MTIRIATLLCLCGLAACSNKTQDVTPRSATDVSEPARVPPAAEPAAKPAALDPTPTATPPASNDESPRSVTNARLVADTKGAAPNAFKPNGTTNNAPGPAPSAAPDNTKVNERDNNSAALTPLDQGDGASDLKITQQIRKAVMADGSLSFTAKNVKIITQNGKVTLRGPVNTEQERSGIEAAARKFAAGADVDNQLEVKK